MAKYIDLLRSHQKQGKSNAIPSSKEDDTPVETLLPDEGLQPQQAQVATPSNQDSLLVDEEPSLPEIMQPQDSPHTERKTLPSSDDDWLNDCTQHVLTLFQHAQKDIACDISPLSKCIRKLLAQLVHDKQQSMMNALELNIAQQTQHIRLIDDDLGSLVQKSILMMLYAIKAGQRLKLDHDELRAHTLAGMLHHIGMAQVSHDIRSKKERLNKSELTEIKKSTQNGYHFLEKCNVTDPCILQAASQSSERYDGRGESGLSGSDIAWSARLTGVLSMFEALIHYRPYRARLLPRDAIREIVKHHKKSFDPIMLKALIESISLYPIGTYVQLNSGEIGMVIRVHPRLPLRPVVHIEMDMQGREIPPRQVDLTAQP
ncbi:MAG: HD domain-containing phosphohydrolase, partial [Mariprofundaceae bacterium]|nr:HD domain-containing phosphohydrolase [Mariprofundaceae bacterium]